MLSKSRRTCYNFNVYRAPTPITCVLPVPIPASHTWRLKHVQMQSRSCATTQSYIHIFNPSHLIQFFSDSFQIWMPNSFLILFHSNVQFIRFFHLNAVLLAILIRFFPQILIQHITQTSLLDTHNTSHKLNCFLFVFSKHITHHIKSTF